MSVLDLTSPSIDRDEPRLEVEVQEGGVDNLIAVDNVSKSASSSASPESKKSKSSATPAVDAGVEEKTEPVLKKGKK
jgi:hypothetical protein